MPELPEVETVRATLEGQIIGRKIIGVDIYYGKIIKNVSEQEFKENLKGRTFKEIKRYGKFLIFILDDLAMISHLRMEGKYFLKETESEIVKHEHIVFHLDNGLDLRYHDVRKFGIFLLKEISEIYTTPPISELGKEPFDETLDVDYLRSKLNHRLPIKSLLLDQTIITGLGNIYVDEVLFCSQINPLELGSSLTDSDLEKIIKYSKEILSKAIAAGGTTIRSYTSSLGVTGRFQLNLLVHTRVGEPCHNCQTIIKKIKVGGRGTYYCPNCQKMH